MATYLVAVAHGDRVAADGQSGMTFSRRDVDDRHGNPAAGENVRSAAERQVRPLFEAAFANFDRHSPAKVNTRNSGRGPLLLISGQRDHTVPDIVTHSTFSQYRHSTAVTDLRRFADRGHSLTIDSGWRDIAETALNWMNAHKL
jgi:pimeloyl-ACP methyl ester carboxylesterase